MRVVLAEQEYLLRSGLVRMLADYEIGVAATVATVPELLAALTEHQPDLAVVDGRLPPDFAGDGVRTALTARAAVPGLPVLVLAEHPAWPQAVELLADGDGGVGYLRRNRVFDESAFVEPLRRVAGGGTAVDEDLVTGLLAECPRHGALAALGPDQLGLLVLLARGLPEPAIAARLGVPADAVAGQVTGLFEGLELPVPGTPHRRAAALLRRLADERAGRTGAQHSPDGR